MIITISTPDKFYFEQLLAFLTSLKINSPKHKAFIRLVDYPTEVEHRLREIFDNYIFHNTLANLIDDRGIGLILLRILLIRKWFQETYVTSVSWIDTDVIIRDDLSEFVSVEPNQLKILYRGDDKPEKVRFNAGVFSVGKSDVTKLFMDRWYERLSDNTKWGMGQLELYKTYNEFRNKVDLVHMDEKFNDLGGSDRPNAFDNSSIIWHCKYAHFNHSKFQKEYQKYLKLGKEAYNE